MEDDMDVAKWLLLWIPMIPLLAAFIWSILAYKKSVSGRQNKTVDMISEDQNAIHLKLLADIRQINLNLKSMQQNGDGTKHRLRYGSAYAFS